MVPIIIALIIAGIICFLLYSQMKSVGEKTNAKDYLNGNLTLTAQSDIYTHTTKTRRKIEKNNK